MPKYPTPKTQEQALTLAVYLGLIAPDDERARASAMLAEELSAGLDKSTVEICRASALERFEVMSCEPLGINDRVRLSCCGCIELCWWGLSRSSCCLEPFAASLPGGRCASASGTARAKCCASRASVRVLSCACDAFRHRNGLVFLTRWGHKPSPNKVIVLGVASADPSSRTAAGIGVGSTMKALRSAYPNLSCDSPRECRIGRCGYYTNFSLKNGRVVEVSVEVDSGYDDGALRAPDPRRRKS